MLNKSPSLLLILTLILTACQGAATSTSMVVPSLTTATEIVGASATAPPTAKTSVASCTVVSREPTPGPTEQSLFPPVTTKDWAIGAETAAVTFIEYSDFQ